MVFKSSVEGELRAMTHGICELLWLRIILNKLGLKKAEPIRLYCEKKLTINITHNPVQHDQTKHIEIDRHFIKEKLDNGLITIPYVSSDNQWAGIFTKGLPTTKFEEITCKVGTENIHSLA